jgi:hypothetical protein
LGFLFLRRTSFKTKEKMMKKGISIRYCERKIIMAMVLAAAFIATLGTSQAYIYTGGDWGGMDFTPVNGDVLSGTFTHIGRFIISAGDTVYAGSNQLTLFTGEALVNGNLYRGAALSPGLNLTAVGTLTLGSAGILDRWESIYLKTGGTMTINGTINVLSLGGDTSLPSDRVSITSGGAMVIDRGGVKPAPVAIPSSILLFGPGLAGLAPMRRRFNIL